MLLLIIGVLAFAALHLMKGVAPEFRANIAKKVGENPYKGLFSLALVVSIALMVFGWQATEPTILYDFTAWAHPVTALLVLFAFILFAAANGKSNIGRVLRHPMLSGLVLWSIGHLLMNGDDRSLVLFGGMGIWAIVEMIVLNKRDGPYTKPKARPLIKELIPVIAGIVVFGVFILLHPILFGVSPLP